MENRFTETYNDITNQLLKRLAADGENNVVISPFSVLMLLGILADATGTETREEIAKILGCEKNLREILEWLKSIQQEMTKSGALVSSNAVCVKHKLKDKIVDIPSSANHGITLREGRENYKKIGACCEEMLEHCRKPKKSEMV